jgi:hypothetical protein
MKQTSSGEVPLDNLRYGITGDLVGDCDPGRQTFFLLLRAVARHAALEVVAFRQCEAIAQANCDAVIALVMRRMLEDEDRHRGLLKRISCGLGDALNRTSPDPLPPTIGPATGTEADLALLAQALMEEERLAVRALRHLAQDKQGLVSGVESLLLEMMATDSETHAHLLQVVQQRLEVRAQARPRGFVSPARPPTRCGVPGTTFESDNEWLDDVAGPGEAAGTPRERHASRERFGQNVMSGLMTPFSFLSMVSKACSRSLKANV